MLKTNTRMCALFYGCLMVVLVHIHTTSAKFTDCTSKKCCNAISELDRERCSSYGLIDCINNKDFCEWDCNLNSHQLLKQNGYTKRRFSHLSKGDAVWNHNINTNKNGNEIPKARFSVEHEPETVDEYIKMTKIIRMDECGVVYSFEMDQDNAQRKFDRMKHRKRTDGGNSNKLQNPRRLTNAGTSKKSQNPRRLEEVPAGVGIFGVDGRKQVTDINDNNEWVGTLGFQVDKDNWSSCTATLISNKFIITSAHCVFPHGSSTSYSGFNFHPDTIDEASFNKRTIGYKNVYAFDQWKTKTQAIQDSIYGGDWDIAWLELSEAVDFGYLALGHHNVANGPLIGQTINIVGYPDDKPDYTKWAQTCKITSEQQVVTGELSFASTDCDGRPGMSGSAAYLDDHKIIGIYGGVDGRGGKFAQITQAKHDTICATMDIGECKQYEETYPTLCASKSTIYPGNIVGYEHRFIFAGKYNGKPYYKNDIDSYLFWSTNSAYKWVWGPELGGDKLYAYTTTDYIDGASWADQKIIDLSSNTCSKYPLCASKSTVFSSLIIGFENRFEYEGEYNGKPYYKNSQNTYLYWTNGPYRWMCTSSMPSATYYARTLTDNIDHASWAFSGIEQTIDLSHSKCLEIETYPTLCATKSTIYPDDIIGYEHRFIFTGTYNFLPYYKNDKGTYLYWSMSQNRWQWGPKLGATSGYYAHTTTDYIDGASWANPTGVQTIDLSSSTCGKFPLCASYSTYWAESIIGLDNKFEYEREYNGKPYYKNSKNMYLYWTNSAYKWFWASSVPAAGAYAYTTTDYIDAASWSGGQKTDLSHLTCINLSN